MPELPTRPHHASSNSLQQLTLFPKSNAEEPAATVPKHRVEGRDRCRLRPSHASCIHTTARFEAELSGSARLLSPSPSGVLARRCHPLARPCRGLATPARAVAAPALPVASAKVATGSFANTAHPRALDSERCRRPGGGERCRRRPIANRDPCLREVRRLAGRGPCAPAQRLSGAHARGLPHACGTHARGRACRGAAATSRLSPVHAPRRGRSCDGVG